MSRTADRPNLFTDVEGRGEVFARAYSDRVDEWLRQLFEVAADGRPGLAVVAVGGYGRRELAPFSDLDVLLVHADRSDIGEVAEALWYPVWDRGVKLGHGVFTIRQAVKASTTELERATSLIDLRHVAGDAALTAALADGVAQVWRKRGARLLRELAERVEGRHAASGDVAFQLEPDLKEGRGGLRDLHALHWAETALPGFSGGALEELAADHATLLEARVALHLRTGRAGDRLVLEEQDGVAAQLGDADADQLMARVAAAARRIGWYGDEAWEAWGRVQRRPRRGWTARIVSPGIEVRDDVVELDPDAPVADDPLLTLRVAASAARVGKRIGRSTLERLGAAAPPLPEPWPSEARELFHALLLAGHPAITVIEALDQHDLMARIVPEWHAVRSRPQRNALHRFTVDRHLCEAAANAASLVDRVRRPELLVVGAFLHDIGKGFPGDHTEVGMGVIADMGLRMGYPPEDIDTLVWLCEQHLLLGDVATRRDLSDAGTIRSVAETVGTVERLRLLAALTEADSIATGPAVWGSWRARLLAALVERTTHVIAGGRPEDVGRDFPGDDLRTLMAEGVRRVWGHETSFTVVAPDRPGLFSSVAGVLALAGLVVLDAAAYSDDDGMATCQFQVATPSHGPIEWAPIARMAERALDGRLALAARLDRRAQSQAVRRRHRSARPPRSEVRIDNELSDVATVVDVHAPDAVGLLYRVTRALAEFGLDIRSAKVQTVGDQAVDCFYLRDASGAKLDDPELLDEVRLALEHALGQGVT
jgi:[protein-PII] uridylyltransferase